MMNYRTLYVGNDPTDLKAASATPKSAGTAAVGTSAKYAREDHVHPLQTTVSGNSGTTTKLATARTISLTGVVTGSASFDGSKNISIATKSDGIGGNIPIGGIIAFSGTFGGTNNRFPIPLGSSTPDTNWCLCDGTTTNGKTVPDLRNKMIMGAGTTYEAGTTGGSATHTHSISGTVGDTTLSVSQIAQHSHNYNIRSSYRDAGWATGSPDFWLSVTTGTTGASGGSGSHTHNFSNTSTTNATSLPPYYALSYIIKIS